MAYQAPVRDIEFALQHVVGFPEVQALAASGQLESDLLKAVLEEAARFSAQVLAPLNQLGDQQGSRLVDGKVATPDGWKEAYQQFCDKGWQSLAFETTYGGQGLPMCVSTAVQEMWHSANMSFGLIPLLTQGAVDAIHSHGSDILKANFLPKMVKGTWTGTMNLTEPQAGSNLAALSTRATPAGDFYRITGQKIFITYGEHELSENIIHLVLARTPDAPPGVKGISLFVVPRYLVNADGSLGDTNDIHCVSLEHKLGIHASPTAVLSFGEKDGAIGYLVGEENRGLVYMFTMMNLARHAVGVEGYAIAERAYQQALAYARERVQGQTLLQKEPGPAPIINHPDIRRQLMTMRANVEAMRMLSLRCAVEFDLAKMHTDAQLRNRHRVRGELFTPLVKGWSSEEGINLCSIGVQIHGGMGYIEETGAAQHLRDSRITAIYEGTTAIQANDLVSRKTLRDGGEAVRDVIAEMRETRHELQTHELSLLSEVLAGEFSHAITDLEAVLEWYLSRQKPACLYAVSVDYLLMFGRIMGAWMHMKSALAAAALLKDSEAADAYLHARLQLAEFYVLRILPEAHALRLAITRSYKVTLSFPEEMY